MRRTAHPEHPDYPQVIRDAAGVAVVEAVPIHGGNATVFIVYFRASSTAFESEAQALAFAADVARDGWDDEWTGSPTVAP